MTAHIAVNRAKLVRSAQPSIPMDIGTPSRIISPMLRAPDQVAHHASTVITTTTPATIRRSLDSGLIGPGEGSKVTVVLSAGVVPIDAERMKMAARCVGKREARVRGMQGVVDVQRFGRHRCAGNALTLLFEKLRNRNGSAKTALLNADRSGFHTKELSNNGRQDCRRSTGLPAGDVRDRLLVLGSRHV